MASVLVLDDDPRISRLMRLILEADSYDVLVADRGQEALDLIDRHHPGLLLVDLMMPEMDGGTFISKAREGGYDGPVIIVSASNAVEAGRRYHTEGAIAKPFDPETLLERVEELLPQAS